MNSDPYQKLMFAVWAQAMNDINRLFLLDEGVISVNNIEKEEEIRENAQAVIDWITKDEYHTFEIIAEMFSIPTKKFREKTLEIIEENKEKIKKRSKTTNTYMYATISRFRNYEQAFQREKSQTHISSE